MAWFIRRDALVGIRDQIVAVAFGYYNWYAIASGGSYFATMNPQLFRHLWFISLLLQCYLIMPIVICLLRALCRPLVAIRSLIIAAVASMVLMGILVVPDKDPTRVYFGTDTHCGGLVLGVALAWIVVRRQGARATKPAWWPVAAPWLAAVALAYLVVLAFRLPQSLSSFRGGIAFASVLSAMAVAGVIESRSWLGRMLDWRPLTFLGRYSYGVYLWHWPIWLLVKAAVPQWGTEQSWLVLLVTMVFTAALARLSWFALERVSARRGLLAALFPRRSRGSQSAGAALLAWIVIVVPSIGCVAVVSHAPQRTALEERLIEQDRLDAEAAKVAAADVDWHRERVPDLAEPRHQMPDGSRISAVGDSIMEASSYGLNKVFPGIAINAKVSRSVPEGIAALRSMKSSGTLRPWVVVGLGTNSQMSAKHLDTIMQLIGPDRILVLVNTHSSGESWAVKSGKLIDSYAAQHPDRVVLVDWNAAVTKHPEVLDVDGVHPKMRTTIYADCIHDAIAQWIGRGH